MSKFLLLFVMIQECSNLTRTCTMDFFIYQGAEHSNCLELLFSLQTIGVLGFFFYHYSERMEFKWGNESLCYMLSLISHLTIYQKNRDYIMKPNILKSNISNEYCCIYKILHILCLINNCGIV